MSINNTFTINFWAHSARAKNGKCPLLVRITVNGKKASIRLKLPVNLKYWDSKKHPKAMGQNTVMKHIQRLRKIVTLGFHIGWMERDPFVRWKPVYEKNKREFLSEEELKSLENYSLPIERLDRVRDLFVFSCYTGISYADLIRLTTMNLHFGVDGK